MRSLTVPAGFNLPHPTIQIFEFIMRTLACSLSRWLTLTRYRLKPERQYETEFPVAVAHLLEWTLRRFSRAAGCASPDALRPINHQKFTKDKHEILYVREKFAPRARAFPPPRRRWPGASAFRNESGATKKGILVKNRRFFCTSGKAKNGNTQRVTIAPAGAYSS